MSTMTDTRALRDSDVDEVLDLMRASLGEPPLLRRTPELFRWKHVDNPFGRSIALVAVEDGRIVGLRALMRWELLTHEGEVIRCVRAVDTATHPDYQRRGIFRRLTEESVEVAASEGVDLIFNTPNEKSKPGYLKMGWREVGPIGALVRPSLRILRGAKEQLLEPARFLRDPQPIRGPLPPDRAPLGLRTPRTAEYVAWRFGAHPSARYFIAEGSDGAAIVRPNLRRGRSELVIADTFGNAKAGFAAATRSARSAYLATWFSKGSPERSAAMRHGFIPIPWLAALTLVVRPLHDFADTLHDMDAWDVAVSDFELL
jgi:GNAT superfamily N-acetyltransferase